MSTPKPAVLLNTRKSAFDELGFKRTIAQLTAEIVDLYRSDSIPWVVGYSGGKDSTATLQLVWLALASLPSHERTKPVHVISTDTLVENPIVAAWVARSLDQIGKSAAAANLPITAHRLTPDPTDTFWVNLIGRGYPAPRPKFRWCTERLKINPSNRFISDLVKTSGEVIVVLGMRKSESQARSKVMDRLEGQRVRERLSPNASLQNSYVYTPVETWTNDDIWVFLMQVTNAWGFNNKDLLTIYQGASEDGECPLVIDTSTPSCGDSRFGCWVCTLVEKDKSMQAMIRNDGEKEWMLPLLDLRNALDVRDEESGRRDDRHLRDFRRMNGAVQLHKDRVIHGPYTQEARETWLRRVLEAQRCVRETGPPAVQNLELITLAELTEIRRLWVLDKHELEDSLPRIYEQALGTPFPGGRIDDNLVLGAEEMRLLRDLCDGDDLHYQLTRELLDVERQHRTMARRAGLFKALEGAIRRGFYESAEVAEARAIERQEALKGVQVAAGTPDFPLLRPLELLDPADQAPRRTDPR
ncbi:DNA phosphorothioation system sulfurtransferase DndC [Methylobacterium sp.]|uniref:DNA phosphorothioation system sulfurtransferase DndC n=1 Tax=Methylobacterium sp. TaxID=409 RepID=UPI000C55C7C6|nr:DNA phosphorothioation system sulfurtransferase DndC [Methylobacterium sp.]MBP33149.1 DNA phosphorothioation system sulfurtransferase DndC [Methylobacterium sp.]